MATLTLTLADADLQRVIVALCNAGGTTPTPENARAFIIAYITQTVANVEEAAWRTAQAAQRGPTGVNIS